MGVPAILSALADENRRRILAKLKEGRVSSGELAQAVGMTPQALSYHLKKLKEAGLICETRQKNFIFCELDLTVLDEAILWLDELRGGGDHGQKNENAVRRFQPADSADADCAPGGAALPAGPHPGPL